MFGGNGIGHAFISIKQGNNIRTFGFYPKLKFPANSNGPGIFGNDSGHYYTHGWNIGSITPLQLQQIIGNSIAFSHSDYNVLMYNCSDFANYALQVVGINTNASGFDTPNTIINIISGMYNILTDMLHKYKDMTILKAVCILSFLLICSVNGDGLPIFIYLLISFIEFFNSFTYHNLGITWEAGLIPILVMGTLMLFCSHNKFRNIYFMFFCFTSLLAFIVSEMGILNIYNLKKISLQFILPFLIFLSSSVIIIFKTFNQNKNLK